MSRIIKAVIGALAFAITAQTAMAADMPRKAPLYKAPVVVPFSWTGFYVGANAGYSWGRASADLTQTSVTSTTATITTGGTPIASATVVSPPSVFAGNDRVRMNGWLGGFQAGYNWQISQWVLGIEGDIQATGERGGTTLFCFPLGTPCGAGTLASGTANYNLRWLGTLRGRAGVTWDRVLLYYTGGLAVGQIRVDVTDSIAGGLLTPATVATASNNVTRAGWVLGAGIEGAVTDNWSVKVEYLHVDLGSFDTSANGLATGAFSTTIGAFVTTLTQTTTFNSQVRARFIDDIVRVGVNYRFGGPVVAKY